MVSVTVNTGPVTAERRARDIPKEKWNLLIGARASFVKTHIPADCRQLFDFIEEARDERMWEHTSRLDRKTGEWTPYADLNDLIQNGLGIDPELANWAIEGLRALRPEELERAVALHEAVKVGKTADRVKSVMAEHPDWTQQQIAEKVGVSQQRVSQLTSEIQAKSEPKLLKHGGKVTEQGSHTNVERGVNRDYILARLKRDGFEELAQQVKAGTVSARKAGMQAGFVKPESALVALKRHWRKASAEERQQFMDWIESGD